MVLPRIKKLRPFSTRLRKEATPEEKHLWYDFLRTYPVQVNRQRIIGAYIADFYCARARLVIELDGNQHLLTQAEEYDAIRTEYFSALEIMVLRFQNTQINVHFEDVCKTIDSTIGERIALLKS